MAKTAAVFLIGTLGLLVVAWLPATAVAAPPPTYTVKAIRYATVPDFPVAELVAGADPKRKTDIAMVIWLIQGDGRTVLLDSGFYRDSASSKFATYRDRVSPAEAVGRAGVSPDEVTDIIISHMHWDHAGGIDLFPRARVWIQREEYRFYTGDAWHTPEGHGGIEPADVLALVGYNVRGQLSFVEGDNQEILPGIRCYTGGKHTRESQYVSVASGPKTIVLASDNAYLYENLDAHAAIGQTQDAKSNLAAQDRMKTLASERRLIVPGHDPAQFDRFRQIAAGVALIE